MTTIKDISKHVGVSVSTVSRALNSSGYVSPEVKRKVMEAAEELGYIPNETARTLNTSISKVIGVLVPDITNPFFPKIIRGIEDAALEKGYRIIIGNTDHDAEKEKKYVEMFHQNNCLGIISATWSIDGPGANSRIPIVLLDRVVDDSISVQADHYKGGMLQAEHLIDSGATKILLIQGPDTYSSFVDRYNDALGTLKHNNIEFSILEYGPSADPMGNINDGIIRKYDGFICPNDLLAYRLLNFMYENGVEVPAEARVIGYDDLEFSKYVYPSLTTIRQPAYELGEKALKTLLEYRDGIVTDKRNFDVQLIKRNST